VDVSGEAASTEQPRRRGRPRRAEARAAILDATVALLAERGFQATTMDAISERAGVGRNTIYRRWCSKEELVAEALDELTATRFELGGGDDVYAVLLERTRDFVRIFSDPVVSRILADLLGELQRNRAFAVTFADRVVRPRRAAVFELLARARRSGALRDVDTDLVADLLVGPPLVRMLFPIGLPELGERYAEDLLATIWNGIASDRSGAGERAFDPGRAASAQKP
jgi:AcrR family transcriptional regulator